MKTFPDVKCPQCSAKGNWLATKWGPFCSERCKMVDLGKWFEESNKISEPLRPDHFIEEEEKD
ncbi:MAG: DNA gyrase inhibitor YacG [Verrucomicrobiota bacterium]